MKKTKISINGKKFEAIIGENLLEFLNKNGFEIPAVCYHSDFEAQANCRMCLIKINDRIRTSCNSLVEPKMEIITNDKELKNLRKTNLKLLLANYWDKGKKERSYLNKLAKSMGIQDIKLKSRKKELHVIKLGDYLQIDLEKCVDCRNCVVACKKQKVEALKVKSYGYRQRIAKNLKNPCIYCGQCMTHCPANAITTNPKFFNEVRENLENNDYINVAQVAPAIRASIGEEFDLDYGEVTAGKLVSGLKKAGFDYVFDTCFGADITTIEEAKELIKRLKSEHDLPMFTSCCPSWVRYLGTYKEELLPYLTSVHSPQMVLARVIKTFWASKMHIPVEKIRMVSVMPCVAKKWESEREDYRINEHWPVDQVITTVEASELFKEKGINFKDLKEENFDNPFGEASGGGYIYGASGGVMLSALRTAYYYLTGNNLNEYGLNILSGQDGLKEFEVRIENRSLRAAVVNGLGNFSKVYGNLDNYDYIEVMTCPGGCIGGGGQPKPVNDEIRNKRAKVLIGLDDNAKTRFAHENPMVKKLYDEFLINEKIRREITHFHRHSI